MPEVVTGVAWKYYRSPGERRMVEEVGVKSEGEMLR